MKTFALLHVRYNYVVIGMYLVDCLVINYN